MTTDILDKWCLTESMNRHSHSMWEMKNVYIFSFCEKKWIIGLAPIDNGQVSFAFIVFEISQICISFLPWLPHTFILVGCEIAISPNQSVKELFKKSPLMKYTPYLKGKRSIWWGSNILIRKRLHGKSRFLLESFLWQATICHLIKNLREGWVLWLSECDLHIKLKPDMDQHCLNL